MRFNLSPPKGEQPYRKWFAWYPVYCIGSNTVIWLETVERKLVYPFTHTKNHSFYVYREIL